MSSLSKKAQVYILFTISCGLFFLFWELRRVQVSELVIIASLSFLASLSLIFKVIGATNRSHYNFSFLIYAFSFILLGTPATIVVILVSNIVEWIWHRYPWYIQLFNLTSYIATISLTGLAFRLINPAASLYSVEGVLAMVAAIAVFTLVNHTMIGVVVLLARGESFQESGVFAFLPLMIDFTLLGMGMAAALVWMLNPLASILVLLPIYLIYSTLRVPALERKTETDPKTGLYNSEYYMRALKSEIRRANRFNRPLSVVMADLDLLRNINNTYGHVAGDEVLVTIAEILGSSAREYDVIARFGGEEFALLIPEVYPEEAFERIDSIRKTIEQTDFQISTSVIPIRATMSFGIAGRSSEHETPKEIIHNADMALYHAKLRGRNRTYIYTPEGILELFGQSEGPRETAEPIRGIEATGDQYPVEEKPVSIGANGSKPPKTNAGHQHQTAELKTVAPLGMLPAWIVHLYIAGVFLVGLVLLLATVRFNLEADWPGIALFAAMIMLAEWYSIELHDTKSSVSTAAAPLLAGSLMFGPLGSGVLSVAFGLAALIKHHSSFSRFIFNTGNQLIATLLLNVAILFSGAPLMEWHPAARLMFSLAGVFGLFLATTSLVSVGIGLSMGAPAREIWKEQFRWLAPYYLLMGLVAHAFVFSYQISGVLGVFVIFSPLVILRRSQKQYLDRARSMVKELQVKNQAVEESARAASGINEELLISLAHMIDLRSPFALGHSTRVAQYAVMLAKKMGLSKERVDLIRRAGLLHDIGRLGVSESILMKPGPFNQDEFRSSQAHVTIGAEVLKTSQGLVNLIPIVRHHHEQFDGKGYPNGLRGEEIPLEARIIALADAIDAMVSERPYRPGLPFKEVIAEVETCSGSQFDPQVVQAFLNLVHTHGNFLSGECELSRVFEKPVFSVYED